MVSSSWLTALCKQLLCLKVTARYLGSGCGLKLGRQAAWRPGTIGMVSSSLLAAPCKQLLCLKVIAETWALAAGSNSVVKLLGGRVSILAGVVKLVGGTVQAVAVFKSDCKVLGLWLRAQTRSSSCLAAGFQSGWCRQVGWRHCASSCCVLM